jgi:L,D-peptidoglycan transpeptidase YkuD (ErfK/YbiS/YcfS/YnhG family)
VLLADLWCNTRVHIQVTTKRARASQDITKKSASGTNTTKRSRAQKQAAIIEDLDKVAMDAIDANGTAARARKGRPRTRNGAGLQGPAPGKA